MHNPFVQHLSFVTAGRAGANFQNGLSDYEHIEYLEKVKTIRTFMGLQIVET